MEAPRVQTVHSAPVTQELVAAMATRANTFSPRCRVDRKFNLLLNVRGSIRMIGMLIMTKLELGIADLIKREHRAKPQMNNQFSNIKELKQKCLIWLKDS